MAKKQEHHWFWRQLDDFLAEKRLNQTTPRKIIIMELLSLKGHISAEELHGHVKSKGHQIGLATVYRTLALLKEAGLVDQKQFEDDKAVFEVLEPGEHHDHLICLQCKKVVEFQNETIEKLQEKIAEERGYQLIHHTLDLFGYCPDCRS